MSTSTVVTPAPGLPYHLLLRRGRAAWWRSLLGVVALLAAVLLVVQLVLLLAFVAGYAFVGVGPAEAADRLSSTTDLSPVGLAYVNLGLASAIPVVWLIVRVLHGLGPGWVASVAGRLRWRWMLTCTGLAAATLVVTVLVGALVPSDAAAVAGDGGVNDLTRTTLGFVVVIVLLTPLQAAGEEYAFRGYLTQVFGALLGRRWVAITLPAVLFALAHGAQDAPVFVDRLAFGLVAGYLVVRTGGLEAGIAMHVLNNFLAYGGALLYGDMATVLQPTGGSWWSLATTLTQSLVFVALVVPAARRRELAIEAPAGELVGPEGRV
ncbi:CPBP family intramembrane metalloprotease [Nocardioides sp. TRM66260-LWL]|uniref:CPBP family intramembrane glutamic endopeptidase n=1 Tax=Nocardioides sp. TRM66260-LWL TaxID=2874478 RepID=UPI001CC66B5C|nr:CPBP family intramembrane glutamic endopeptidase [Nocardioides sp. TRM66260-LWL]MBZ5733120.1 CPBP family intramembrane metalloprotease [Nocardioides sp. TRM66260-LWL]